MTRDEQELSDLALANRHISEAQVRIEAQQLHVNALHQSGSDSTQATDLLKTMEQTLEQFHEHRLVIIRTLERK